MWLDGEDQDKTWLDGPCAMVKGKLEALKPLVPSVGRLKQDLAPRDRSDGEEQVRSRSMDQKPCDDMKWIISFA